MKRLVITAVSNIVCRSLKLYGFLAATPSAGIAVTRRVSTGIAVTAAILFLFHNLVIRLLNLLKLFFRLLPVWIIDIGIRMVFPA